MKVSLYKPAHLGTSSCLDLQILGPDNQALDVVSGNLGFDFSTGEPVTCRLEVMPNGISMSVDATLYTRVLGVRYRLVEDPE